MKANAHARRHTAGDDRAVSSVVSAVLVFSLFSTAFALWSTTQFPGWVEDREANHQNAVREALAQAQGSLEQLSSSDQAGPVTLPIALSARPIPLLGGVPTAGRLHMEPGLVFDASFTAPRLHVAGSGAAGTPTAAPQTVTDVHTLQNLHVSLDSTSVAGQNDQAWIEATLYDATTTLSARLIHGGSNVVESCGGSGVAVRVTTDAGSRDSTLLCDAGSSLTDFTVDLLEPRYGLAGRLGDLTSGFSLDVDTGAGGGGGVGADGTFLATWSDADGHTRVVGSGTSVPGYTILRTGSRLVFEPSRAEAVPESLSWQFGGVVADQGNARGVTISPDLAIAVDGTTGTLRWTLTHLSGTGDVTGGDGSIQVLHDSTSEVVLSATGAELVLTTPTAAAWRNLLSAQVQAAGASDATVSGTGTEARLSLATGTVTQWVLHLRVIDANVSIR